MEKMKDLKDLLMHEVEDLYSAEEQIIEALPSMIEKAQNAKLVSALKNHLKVTEQQKERLDKVKEMLDTEPASDDAEQGSKKGFFGNLFGGSNGKHVCRGMKGLIEEGEKVMGEKMDPEVLDAAIIACAQKIEHYEICGYGTARAYARELNLGEVAERLEETLNEEYEADDLLTDLAVGGLNEKAEKGDMRRSGSRTVKSASSTKTGNSRGGAIKKSTGSKKASSSGSSSSKSKLGPNKSKATKSGAKSSSAKRAKAGGSRKSKSGRR